LFTEDVTPDLKSLTYINIVIIIIIKKELIIVTLHEVAGALNNVSRKCLLMHLVRYTSDLLLVVDSAKH